MKANIKKDDDGLDNIDDFWDDEDAGNNTASPENDLIEDDNTVGENESRGQGNNDRPRTVLPRVKQGKRPSLFYLDQELPEELLSTPTSRRTRNISKGGGGSGSSRGKKKKKKKKKRTKDPSFFVFVEDRMDFN
jgi:hypothetical protein